MYILNLFTKKNIFFSCLLSICLCSYYTLMFNIDICEAEREREINIRDLVRIQILNLSKHKGRALYAPPSLAFYLLLNISSGNPYLKIFDIANLFVADAPTKKKNSITPSQSTLKNRSKNRPCLEGLKIKDDMK